MANQRLARYGCLVADVASVIGAGCAVELQLRGAACSTAWQQVRLLFLDGRDDALVGLQLLTLGLNLGQARTFCRTHI